MASLLPTLLLVGATVSPAHASIAAWWNGYGTQVMLLNSTTNQIRYSTCNSQDEPRYSYTDGSVLSLSHKPKPGTPLAGTGWWDESKTIASMFYIDNQGDIINALFNCNMSTGLFQNQGEWPISTNVPSIHANSGLAAVLLGDTAGYRVYFHDNDSAINELGYTTADGWNYRGVISHDINSLPGLGAAFSGTDNITVVSPRDSQNIATTRLNADSTWFRSTLPHPLQGNPTTADTNRSDIAINETASANFSLPAWDGTTKGIGISIDKAFTRFVWYIGNDGNLYSVANQNYIWALRANQSSAFWPKADDPNAELAVAYDQKSSTVRIYYMVKDRLSEVLYQDGVWKAWSTVAAPPPQATVSSTTNSTSSADASTDGSGLSTGAKAGIGVGVSLGAISLGAIIAVIVLVRRKKNQGFEQADEGSTTLGPGTPAPSYGSPAAARASAVPHDQYAWEKSRAAITPQPEQQHIHQLDSVTAPTELDAVQPIYELPDQSYSHELVAEPPRPRQ
ncbi:uncharacterized protein THITE_2112937 [Thermothielavioides terrestris NRRL 8126]|uniref:Fucose-specific lectin n=1 Tax=Thermothielavioides terrestris (strain ATCC 38088 / NRRL 8126) TaxID=578455 RepID=G2R1F6_THETT|nr:uncharacterized protein THITE_2112937 [Thermothielavioides terrestris NRRL 8126]AEO65695.1 hypothetical protein THITE_2112937 [Thermothielavioides terrestris NRRL 8126]